MLNWVLKHTIKAARPTLAHPFVPKYGMPSNHAQFMGFAAVYISLWACKRWRVTARAKAALIVAVQAAAAAVMVSRVYLVYHSVEQVLVGYAVGAAAACTWFALVETVARPRFRTVAASAWARALRLRDCTHCAHVLQEEYAATLAAAEAAAKSAAAATSGSNMKRE
ncbi:phosphatase PAP2 family protein [archaeon]|nr:MAG: phosphatase PAP2 family protein [archaeon]